jgi:hypothetical protein
MAMSVTYTTIVGEIVYVPDALGSTAELLSPTGTVTDTYCMPYAPNDVVPESGSIPADCAAGSGASGANTLS